ncbi:sigma factor [Microvirga sp. 17 mud 1-3]
MARSVLNDDAEAEDVVQKAYVRAFSTCDAVRSKGPL